jgi:2'-5' RNA ligase
MRLFVAIDLDKNAKEKISGIIDRMNKSDYDVKWVDPENIHITLKFLGEVRDEQVKGVVKTISDNVNGMKKFTISICEVGYFGHPDHVKVIWLNVNNGRERVIDLCKTMDSQLSHVRHEDHEPSPHITIGRVRSNRNIDMLVKTIGELGNMKLCEVNVNEIKLKRSILDKSGPVYSDIETFTLD